MLPRAHLTLKPLARRRLPALGLVRAGAWTVGALMCFVGGANAQAITAPTATNGGANPAVFLSGVGGRTPQFCSISSASLSNTILPVNVKSLTGATLEIETLVNPTTLQTQAASVQLAMQAVCNYPHELTLSSANNGLWRQSSTSAAPPAPFASAVPYLATASWGVQDVSISADTASRRPVTTNSSVDEPRFGNITLSLQIDPGASNVATNSPLLAGTYSDLITITLGPQP
jgi:hypothetical protein